MTVESAPKDKKNTTQDESQRVCGKEKTALWKKQKIHE
jgi:hypothetical protein